MSKKQSSCLLEKLTNYTKKELKHRLHDTQPHSPWDGRCCLSAFVGPLLSGPGAFEVTGQALAEVKHVTCRWQHLNACRSGSRALFPTHVNVAAHLLRRHKNEPSHGGQLPGRSPRSPRPTLGQPRHQPFPSSATEVLGLFVAAA